MKKQITKASSVLLSIALVLLISFSVGVAFCAFFDYRSGSSGVHTINKLGYVEVTAITDSQPIYPGATFDASFTIQNSVKDGYGTLPIVVESIAVQKVEAEFYDGTTNHELATGSDGVVNYILNTTGVLNTVIKSSQTATINFTLTIKPSATFAEASNATIDEENTDYLLNKTKRLIVTFSLQIEEDHTITG